MKTVQFGSGTYIVREDAQRDLGATLLRLEALGFDGAELLELFGHTAGELRQLPVGKGFQIAGDHIGLTAFLKKPDDEAAKRAAAGLPYITLSVSGEEIAQSAFEDLVKGYEKAVEICLSHGLTLLYHNHDYDMAGDAPFAERLLDAVPALSYEPDLGWIFVAGHSPARLLKKYADRCPVIHLKDVYVADGGFTFRPTGYGNLNLPDLMPGVLACNPEWLIIDHDLAYDRDSYEDLALSLEYVRNLLRVM